MEKVRVAGFGLSLDGFGAGPGQDLENPLGRGGAALHQWAFHTRTFRRMFGEEGGSDGIDERFAAASFERVGAWILGRNMFGPVRGNWPDESWKGWWGDAPPYRCDVFILTHYARPSIPMDGGTTFHFVTDGIEAALERAKIAAAGKDVRIGGGVETIRQYLAKGLIDELHLAVAPLLFGKGENLFTGLDLPTLGYAVTDHTQGEKALHVTIRRDV